MSKSPITGNTTSPPSKAEAPPSDQPPTVVVLGASSDIGRDLLQRYTAQGYHAVGTYRQPGPLTTAPPNRSTLFACDVSRSTEVDQVVRGYRDLERPWDVFISAVGTEEPIGAFFESDFDSWESSLAINFTAQLRFLHGIYPLRRKGQVCHAIFFAGGGTNNPFPNYSAYCVSKIALMKMCELLHSEVPDLNVFILGPGWVRTKIHQETLRHPLQAGENFGRTKDFLDSSQPGTSMDDIFHCIQWCIEQGRETVGGRNLSVVHDPWRVGGNELRQALRDDSDKFKLRRHANTSASSVALGQNTEKKHDGKTG